MWLRPDPNYNVLLADERSEMATGTLILNASYEPHCVVSLKRGINLVLAKKAEVLEEGDEVIRSERMEMKVPSVIRLFRFVKVPYNGKLPLCRKNLAARDKGKCAYCHKPGETIDHVMPRSRGGLHTWTNVVWCCKPCNQKKKDKTLDELGWRLPFEPKHPRGLVWFTVGITIENSWEPYLAVA